MATTIIFQVRGKTQEGWLADEADGAKIYNREIIYDITANRLKVGTGKKFSETEYLTDDDNDTTYDNATQSADGLMSKEDKKKLDEGRGGTDYTHPSHTPQTGQPTGNVSPKFGGTFTVSQIKSDEKGHVTAATNRTITIPSAVATTSADGLMSAADKKKLNNIAEGATKYTHPTPGAKSGGPTANAKPAFGGTFTVPQVASDANGHVSSITNRTITMPKPTTEKWTFTLSSGGTVTKTVMLG